MSIKSVLIVEDEYFIADELARAVRAAGHMVVGPVGRASDALALLKSTKVDCAILDLHLDGNLTLDLGSVLDEAGIPFVITSGFDCEVLEGAFETHEFFVKPVVPDRVVSSAIFC